jgi:hypothetical protein
MMFLAGCFFFMKKVPLYNVRGFEALHLNPTPDSGLGLAKRSEGMRKQYRGTSLVRNRLLLCPYTRPMPRALWWS